jgi:dCMP deaminase
MNTLSDWDNRYLDLAKHVSTWSKDPSRKIGAVAVGDSGQILSQGYNGFPRGIIDYAERLQNRQVKYAFVVHAEMNVIYNASLTGVSLAGSTLYVYGLPVCSECAKGVIQVGIKRVVMSSDQDIDDKWRTAWDLTTTMFTEAGVDFLWIEK